MTRWLLIGLLVLGPIQSFAYADGFTNIPKCKGVERGNVTFKIMPDGSVTYYIADRPITSVTGFRNLTCSFELSRRVQLLEEL